MRHLPDADAKNKRPANGSDRAVTRNQDGENVMDWDDVRAPANKTFAVGEPLSTLSIAELEARVIALDAEIARIKTEIAAKRRQADAANALFK